MTSAFETHTKRYVDQLSPKAQQIVAQLPADVDNLVFYAALDAPNNDEYSMSASERRAVQRARVQRAVPMLSPLSDAEIDVVITVAYDDVLKEDALLEAREDFWNRLEGSLEILRDNGSSEPLQTLMREDYAKLAVVLQADTARDAKRWAMLLFACERVFPR